MTLGSGGQKIEARHLTKRYASTLAVDDLSFDVNPGMVTGFIGPNGSGKTTTMRLILGLSASTSGEVTVAGRRYRDLPAPLREVGALIDAKAVHPSRTAYHYQLALAQSNAIAASRVDEVLGLVSMEGVAGKRVGGFSLGMSQRLGIAGALLGDPPVLMFDEPLNGLDPEGIVWIRQLMRRLAGEGRTVKDSNFGPHRSPARSTIRSTPSLNISRRPYGGMTVRAVTRGIWRIFFMVAAELYLDRFVPRPFPSFGEFLAM
jgi:ABC-type multidrug transport system ATPase subunit